MELWQADHEGRYSGFRPFRAVPGQVVTSASVPRDIVAPPETFLRGSQETDDRGMCAFDSIYPGWYSSRAVHIHLSVRHGEFHAVTQLYFPEQLTHEVFARQPYAERDPRDTTNDTDGIFIDGGEQTVLDVVGDVTSGLTGVICLTIDPHRTVPADMISHDCIHAVIEAHIAAVHFRATPAGGAARDVIDTMTFDAQTMITAMRADANHTPDAASSAAPQTRQDPT